MKEESTSVARCIGRVWTEPAPVIQMGQTIPINCHYNTEPCQEAKLHLQLNGLLQNSLLLINKTTVQLQLHNYTEPYSTVICFATCRDKAWPVLICGTQFCVGVIPATPIITEQNTVASPVFKTILQWRKRTAINGTYCEERYKEAAGKTWHIREWETDFKRQYQTEYHLDANTKYEFQVRCRLTRTGRFWSQWSNSTTYMTPETVPSSVLDVWRHLGPVYENGSQEITVLIKPFHPKESRGRILDYSVFWENHGEMMNLHNTTETTCKVLVPAAVTTVYVTARNSKGSSKPANITVKQQPHNDYELPSPTNTTVIRDEQNGISVMWEPPESIGKLVLWYIVEWTSGDWHHHYQHDTVWKKVPIQNTTTYIQGDIQAGQNLNISVYAVYQDGVSKACSVQSFSKDQLSAKKPQDGRADNDLESTFAATDGRKGQCWALQETGSFCLTRNGRSILTSDDISKVETMGPMTHNSTRLFLDYEDVVITEVEETLVHTALGDDNNESRDAVSEHGDSSPEVLLVDNSVIIEENGYKPQVSNKTLLGDGFCSTYKMQSQNLDIKSNPPAPSMNILIKDCPSPMASIWPLAGTDENMFSLEKMSLVLNDSRSGQSRVVSLTDEGPNLPMENLWQFPWSDDNTQEQTFIPNELLSSLRVGNEDSTAIISYFPQSIAK
ncbi:hypothetical protein lerEdw1_011749 [Lerista edwardsae]|nr:hypothetical protein lerEdw1_011749 [Lerista edwardsae]